MTIQLRKASFRKWLRGQEPTETVGLQLTPNECPLARFLTSRGAESVWVLDDTYALNRYGPQRPLPGWALRYREIVDASPDPKGYRGTVTGAYALHLLEATP